MRKVFILAATLVLMAGCASDPKPNRTLTQRQRDSLIAESPLPGAPVVERALATSDIAERRAAGIDSLAR